MFFNDQKSLLARSVMVLALVAGMFGMTPVSPAHADTVIVTNTNDSGPGSLRQAIFDVTFGPGPSFGKPITFDSSLAGETITLTSQIDLLTLFNLTIDGSGLNPPVVVSGGNTSGILKIGGSTTVSISDIAFTQAAATDGGAIQIGGTTPLNVENCTFYQNEGGAINASGSGDVTIVDSTFDQNQGSAVTTSGLRDVTITNSIFTNNSTDGNGGAISGGSILLTDSTLSGNMASGSGGAIKAAKLTIKNSTIIGNRADSAGGAIALEGNSNSTISNSTVFENQAGKGGAIFTQGTVNIDIFNSTFAANNAPVGSELWLNGITDVNLYNSILACIPGNSPCWVSPVGLGSVGGPNSIIATGTLASFGLAEPADNGGPTQTMALLPGSPLIDAGDDTICTNAPVNNLDQRGVSRLQGNHCDIGAYEDQALVRFVKQDAAGIADGSSWGNAHTDLQSALAAAIPDEEIWVAAGTYKPTTTEDRTISFVLKNGVAVYGGFAGTETARAQRNAETNLTTLSGDIGIQGDHSDNSYHVVVGSNTNSSAILDGFVITAGNANDTASPQYYYGGGMYIAKGSPRLNGLIFADNHAGFGGGIYASHTEGGNTAIDLVLTNITFRDNTASGEGGGLATLFRPDLSSASFRLGLTDVLFENNTAVRTGGGLINNGGELELVNVSFRGNTASGGGGLSNIPLKPSILTNVTFSNNSASDGGGGMLIGSSGPVLSTLTNVTFSNNSTDMSGGGIANAGYSDLLLTNVTFSDNLASVNGGGISNGGFAGLEGGGTIDLIHTTFSNNAANSNGGAIYSESGKINIHNSILYGDSGGELFDSSGTAVVTHSIVQGGYIGIGNLNEDPLLLPLQDNGGLTETMAPDSISPAIDAGDDTNCADTDQRGVPRPQGSHCDMGAYEADHSSIDVTIRNSDVGSHVLFPHTTQRKSYPNVNSGPVRIINTDGFSSMASERVLYKVNGLDTSFSEMMALPASQVDTVYWLPWYNSKTLNTQLRIANVSATDASVHVRIGGAEVTGSPFTVPAGGSVRKTFPNIDKGPVEIVSDHGEASIVAAERVIYRVNGVDTSFTEMMAMPASQVDTTYWLPWYNSKTLNTQIRIANVSNAEAEVHVTIGGTEVTGSPFTIPAGGSVRKTFPNIDKGPVLIESDQDIVAAERVIYKVNGVGTSFSEMMALPAGQVDTTYWLPWYNSKTLDTQLRIANVGNAEAEVHVFIGGTEVTGSPFTVLAGGSVRKTFPNIDKGPVKIVSDGDIIAAERVIYRVSGVDVSFSEMMGLPNGLLDTIYWLPWYNNRELDTQLRLGVP